MPALAQFSINALDRTADPCVNFYQYACGTWMKNNPVPGDQSRWGRFDELQERNRNILWEILEKDTGTQVGVYYAACMDTAAINRRGLAGLKPELDRIAGLRAKSELAGEVARLHRRGVAALFGFGSSQDFKNSEEVIAEADQAGLGLPERDYYVRTDAKSVEIRKEYVAHVAKMFELLGDAAAVAGKKAGVVMALETALAKGSLDITTRRDPEKVYHKSSKGQLDALAPSFGWEKYLALVGAPRFEQLNIAVPEFFKAAEQVLRERPLADWQAYLTWHLVHDAAPTLPVKFDDETFHFYSVVMRGVKEQRPRWKRCVDYTDEHLGEALGKLYVEKTFGEQGKQRTLAMVRAVEKAMETDLKQLPWMSAKTKHEAMLKLEAITNKIGYPDKWRDYSSVKVMRDDAAGNRMRAEEFEFQRQLNKIGRPVDKREWGMTPPTVNAYYDPQMNNINFPAGILQPPFYDNKLDDGANFGAIGAVVGHELTHGFDDQGRQFDPKGNLRDWWTPADGKQFEQRAECFVKQYGGYVATGDVRLNGKLTLGENAADNGGLRLAYMALMETLGGKAPAKIDGFTPEQRLFLGWAQVWCQNATEESKRYLAQNDPHSPGQFRVNGVVTNMPEFQKAFACKVGQPMVSADACRIW